MLDGGDGNDVLTGGAGADYFVFTNANGATSLGALNFGNDTVTDFKHGVDMIDRAGMSNLLHTWSDITSHMSTDSHGDVVITFGTNASITLVGVHMGDLTINDFQLS